MKAKIKRFDKTLPLPEYQTGGAACFDLASREDVSIKPGEVGLIPLNVAVDAPEQYFIFVVARSSLHKRGLMLVNGIGIIDSDYCGDNDEIKAPLYNFSNEEVLVKKGERTVQAMLVNFEKVEWEEVDSLENEERGGFGITG